MRSHLAVRAAVQGALFLAFLAAVILGSAGTVHDWRSWVYLGIFFGSTVGMTSYLLVRAPDLLERRLAIGERGESRPVQKRIQVLLVLDFLAIYVLAGLDHRWGWSRLPDGAVIVAEILVASSFVFIYRVFRANRFSSSVIEVSAQQKVIDTGPYRLVRHPMYLGGLLLVLATPIALGSYLGELPAAMVLVLIVVRLLDEEHLLADELTGYQDYARRTRYRLIPGLW